MAGPNTPTPAENLTDLENFRTFVNDLGTVTLRTGDTVRTLRQQTEDALLIASDAQADELFDNVAFMLAFTTKFASHFQIDPNGNLNIADTADPVTGAPIFVPGPPSIMYVDILQQTTSVPAGVYDGQQLTISTTPRAANAAETFHEQTLDIGALGDFYGVFRNTNHIIEEGRFNAILIRDGESVHLRWIAADNIWYVEKHNYRLFRISNGAEMVREYEDGTALIKTTFSINASDTTHDVPLPVKITNFAIIDPIIQHQNITPTVIAAGGAPHIRAAKHLFTPNRESHTTDIVSLSNNFANIGTNVAPFATTVIVLDAVLDYADLAV